MKERISVIITSLGNKKFLQRSINSVRSQTLVPWEIIVVIDGSNAEVVDWLENLNVSNLIVFETVSKRGERVLEILVLVNLPVIGLLF